MKRAAPYVIVAVVCAGLLAACDSGGSVFELRSPDIPQKVDPADFVQGVSHPLWPLKSGSSWRFRTEEINGTITDNFVDVLAETRTVDGVDATVVWDRVFNDGELIEETWDWYAQDRDGNVWYLGEETYEYQNGERICACGAWESGVDGALAGIFVPADPQVGDIHYQEYYQGVAEDTQEIMALDVTVTVDAGTFSGCVHTRDTTPLAPQVLEHKYLCPGVGVVLTINVAAGDLRDELVSWDIP